MRFATSFELDGDLIFVRATITGPANSAQIRLVLDTGAVMTTMSSRVIERGYILRVVELSALGFTAARAAVDVAELGHDIDGVLGMSFLLDFNFEVRTAERLTVLEPLASV